MAQTVFINATLASMVVSVPDVINHPHTISRGSSASGDITVSLDPTKVHNLNVLRGVLAQVIRLLDGGSELTR